MSTSVMSGGGIVSKIIYGFHMSHPPPPKDSQPTPRTPAYARGKKRGEEKDKKKKAVVAEPMAAEEVASEIGLNPSTLGTSRCGLVGC